MIRRPPRSTRTDTLFPYTTLFRSQLVIHNAAYDVGFLRDECNLIDHIWPEYPIIDTLKEAAKKFPGARHSLDALCNRFGVDTSSRTKHGALIDRSEERRVGKECVSTCRSRWSQYPYTKKTKL